jgi:hypothetical protein
MDIDGLRRFFMVVRSEQVKAALALLAAGRFAYAYDRATTQINPGFIWGTIRSTKQKT